MNWFWAAWWSTLIVVELIGIWCVVTGEGDAREDS